MSKTILIVEDSPDDEVVLRRALTSAGITNPVHVVRDGREALAFLQGSDSLANLPFPSVLFLDLLLPAVDGWKVLRWLHSHDHRNLLVVVITGYEDRHSLSEAYQLGADSFLFKPINTSEVMDLIENWPNAWTLDPSKDGRVRPQSRGKKPKSAPDRPSGETQKSA